MQCKDCELWVKREKKTKNRAIIYPAGICNNKQFRHKSSLMFTGEDIQCNKGIKKPKKLK